MKRTRQAPVKRTRKAPIKKKTIPINHHFRLNLAYRMLVEFGFYRQWMMPYFSEKEARRIAGNYFMDKRKGNDK